MKSFFFFIKEKLFSSFVHYKGLLAKKTSDIQTVISKYHFQLKETRVSEMTDYNSGVENVKYEYCIIK